MPIELTGQFDDMRGVQNVLQRIPSLVATALQETGKSVQKIVKGRTPLGVRESRGTARQSWSEVDMTSSGYSFENPVAYGAVLEEGLYPGVGPRTVAASGGIYSRQAVGGILGPFVEDDVEVSAILTTVIDEVMRQLGGI